MKCLRGKKLKSEQLREGKRGDSFPRVTLFFLLFLVLPMASAQFGYNNPYLPQVHSPISNLISFLRLSDTPSTYSGANGYCVIVNGSGLSFQNCTNITAGGGGGDANYSNFTANLITNLGNLNATNDTQFDITNGQLDIDQSWISAFIQAIADLLYQPLENQRVSTTDNVTFDDITTTGSVNITGTEKLMTGSGQTEIYTNASGATIINSSGGGIYIYLGG